MDEHHHEQDVRLSCIGGSRTWGDLVVEQGGSMYYVHLSSMSELDFEHVDRSSFSVVPDNDTVIISNKMAPKL